MSTDTRNKSLVTPVFKTMAVQNDAKSKAAGRPIFDDVEMVEVRIAGDRHFNPCFPAHSFWQRDEHGYEITYAMRWPEQYRRFKENSAQSASGTPLEELPFLTQAKRSELKALSIYTAEALSALDGRNLKTLGIGGRELKDQATAYLAKAAGSADVVRLAAQNADMQAQIETLRQQLLASQKPAETAEPSDDDLKARIKELTGAAPRGTPSRETLERMVAEAEQSEAA
jgi:hypothetical protein